MALNYPFGKAMEAKDYYTRLQQEQANKMRNLGAGIAGAGFAGYEAEKNRYFSQLEEEKKRKQEKEMQSQKDVSSLAKEWLSAYVPVKAKVENPNMSNLDDWEPLAGQDQLNATMSLLQTQESPPGVSWIRRDVFKPAYNVGLYEERKKVEAKYRKPVETAEEAQKKAAARERGKLEARQSFPESTYRASSDKDWVNKRIDDLNTILKSIAPYGYVPDDKKEEYATYKSELDVALARQKELAGLSQPSAVSTPAQSDRVTVQDKNGAQYSVPRSQLQQALSQGYIEVK